MLSNLSRNKWVYLKYVISDYYIVMGPKAYRCYNSEKLKFLDKYAFEIYEAVKGYE